MSPELDDVLEDVDKQYLPPLDELKKWAESIHVATTEQDKVAENALHILRGYYNEITKNVLPAIQEAGKVVQKKREVFKKYGQPKEVSLDDL